MPKWLWVVVVIIAFFVVAGLVERRRVLAMEAWRRAHGFTEIDPFVPDEHPVIQRAAARVTGREPITLRWASVITGVSNGSKVTLAEISYSPTAARTSKWFTLAVWDGDQGWQTEGLLTPARADELLARRALKR